jgi:hypothetical protein
MIMYCTGIAESYWACCLVDKGDYEDDVELILGLALGYKGERIGLNSLDDDYELV